MVMWISRVLMPVMHVPMGAGVHWHPGVTVVVVGVALHSPWHPARHVRVAGSLQYVIVSDMWVRDVSVFGMCLRRGRVV